MENDFLLQDRLQKIRQIITKYGEDNFYVSYSGGKDSNVVSALVDLALPKNTIPRVYCDTGIELTAVRNFVKKKRETDSRIEIVKPEQNIKNMLEEEGYPFKSKEHSYRVYRYQRDGELNKEMLRYLSMDSFGCPKVLKYQFENPDSIPFKVSDKCCDRLKKDPLHKWQRERETLRYTWSDGI